MIGGCMISVNWISQVNVVLDNDMVVVDGVGLLNFNSSENLLFNGATINTTGVNAYRDMSESFETASKKFADGANDLASDVAQDSVFEGVDLLRVLYIDGDLTTINWIDQINVLGDSDQVYLAMENAENASGVSATVTAGSNLSINMATINEHGVDSEVMVKGEVYDDALLYQAELIDTDAAPTGVDLPALASEAVVFLADGMVGAEDASDSDMVIAPTPSENVDTPDVMQSVLA
jgi:hypothetical protein